MPANDTHPPRANDDDDRSRVRCPRARSRCRRRRQEEEEDYTRERLFYPRRVIIRRARRKKARASTSANKVLGFMRVARVPFSLSLS